MAAGTKIRWAQNTWNVAIGCKAISPGCDHCYAEVLTRKRRGNKGWPDDFAEPAYKLHKLDDPRRWAKNPARIFVNSLSDVHYEAFTVEQTDAIYDQMLRYPMHDYLVLTKRPQRMAAYFLGSAAQPGYLERRGLDRVPAQIWLGTTIESDRYTFRANHLRRIPVDVRFLSCEPLLTAVPSLNLDGLGWVIAGGESGNGSRNYRPMDPEWAADLWHRCEEAGVAYYFKQSSGARTEMRPDLLGRLIEEYPFPPPAVHGGNRPPIGIYRDVDYAPEAPVTIGQGALL